MQIRVQVPTSPEIVLSCTNTELDVRDGFVMRKITFHSLKERLGFNKEMNYFRPFHQDLEF